eukprot:jgi/Ulvmu1/11896/UM081_0055.1
MSKRFSVVDSRFCADDEVHLRLSTSWMNKDYTVCNLPSNLPCFAVKGTGYFKGQNVVYDDHGVAIATTKQPKFGIFHPHMRAEGPGYSFVMARVRVFGLKATAEVVNKQTGKQHSLHMYGSWMAKSMKLYVGELAEGGQLIAYASRQSTWGDVLKMKQTYELTVMPGVDSALCVLCCMAFDGFWQQQN